MCSQWRSASNMHGSFKNIDFEDCGLIIFLIHFTLSPEVIKYQVVANEDFVYLFDRIYFKMRGWTTGRCYRSFIYFIESTLRQEGGLQDVAIEVLFIL